MAAVLTKAAATTVADNHTRAISRLKYEGGGPGGTPIPSSVVTLLADYKRMLDALVLVKADGAYGSLAGGTTTAVNALGALA